MKKIRIFLASSAELDDDKEHFELLISQKNKDWHQKRLFIELVTWKDFISAMSEGRTQDEYNKYIHSSDIVVFLFHTKLGRYTKEEFDNAHWAFMNCNDKIKKPRIYTYFKSNAEESKDIADFRLHIDGLGHFYDTYTSLEDLFIKFNRQLDKLENEGKIIKPEVIDKAKFVKYAVYFFLLPLLVLTGGFLAFYYFQPTDMTIKIKEKVSIPGLPFKSGQVTLIYGDKSESLNITDEVQFKQIPSKFKHQNAKLIFIAEGYNPIDTTIGVNDMVILPIQRDNSLSKVFGWVRDEDGKPIKEVNIMVKNLKTQTDENGNFSLTIPFEQQSDSIRLTAIKDSYKVWDFTGAPSQTIEWKIILVK